MILNSYVETNTFYLIFESVESGSGIDVGKFCRTLFFNCHENQTVYCEHIP